MANSSTPVQIGDTSFDLGQVGDWIADHPLLAAIILLVAYIFWISRKDGLLGAILEFRIKRKELDARVETDRLKLMKQFVQRDTAVADPADEGGESVNGREE